MCGKWEVEELKNNLPLSGGLSGPNAFGGHIETHRRSALEMDNL